MDIWTELTEHPDLLLLVQVIAALNLGRHLKPLNCSTSEKLQALFIVSFFYLIQ